MIEVDPVSVSGTPPSQCTDDNDSCIPPVYKREGSDWFAVFNPNVKRELDVQLVHNLMHERCVFQAFLREAEI